MLGLPLVREDALIGGTQQHDACRRVSVGAGERLGQCHLQLAADRVQFLRPVARFYAIEISEFGKSPSPRD